MICRRERRRLEMSKGTKTDYMQTGMEERTRRNLQSKFSERIARSRFKSKDEIRKSPKQPNTT